MVAITGIGIVSAIGLGAEETLLSLRENRSGIGSVCYLDTEHKELPVGEVKLSNAEMKQLLGVPEEQVVSRTTLMGALAARQALANNKPEAGMRVAFISGTTVGGMDVTERLFSQMQTDDNTLQHLQQHDCGANSTETARLAGLECEVCTISTACSSALNAIMLGCEMLSRNETDFVVAGGSEALSLFHLNGFNTLMILDKERCRPFDATRRGLNLGEGAAYVVLRRSEDVADENRSCSYPVILGYGNRCDAYHQTATSSNGEGAYLAMTDALQMAGLSASDIDYVNAHGTGTPDNDASESRALRRVFGDSVPPVSSTKSFTGHTTSASGAIEVVISLLAMHHGFIPANLGWETQDEECITPASVQTAADINCILCNSFGFGGNDSSLVIARSAEAGGQQSLQSHHEADVAADVTLSNEEQLSEVREYVAPKELRRMGRLLKAATLTSMKALKAVGIDCPDAIITATKWGMLETSERFLRELTEQGEQTLSPTLFMQSTHNTIGSQIAIRLGCHGYNTTYTQGEQSLEWALRDARRMIQTGRAKTVLVGSHDEATPLFQDFMKRAGQPVPPAIYSRSIVVSRI